jgi:hypothetical protein
MVTTFRLATTLSALAQGPTLGVGRTPSADELRLADISIGPTGAELPPGRGGLGGRVKSRNLWTGQNQHFPAGGRDW